MKNFSVASGFLLIVVGTTGADLTSFIAHPLASSRPYPPHPSPEGAMTDNPTPDEKSGPKPKVPYWHLWVDGGGVSHQTECALTDYVLKGVGDADPQWNNQQPTVSSTIIFTVQPVGWVGDWHENPAPQWIVVLSGRWWIESMDGTRVEQGPGEFSFGEDQGCTKDNHGRKGHRSGVIGDQPAVLMTVQLHIDPIPTPCHLT